MVVSTWPRLLQRLLLQRLLLLLLFFPLMLPHLSPCATPVASNPSSSHSRFTDYDYAYPPTPADYPPSQYAAAPPPSPSTPHRRWRRRYPRMPSNRVLRSHRAHARSRASIPLPDDETEPFYLHTMSRRTLDTHHHQHPPPSLQQQPYLHPHPAGVDDDAEDADAGDADAAALPMENDDPVLRNSTTLRPLQRSETWTPKQQDSIISGWFRKIGSLFGRGSKGNATASPHYRSSSTAAMPQQQQKQQADHLLADTGEQADGLPPQPPLEEQEQGDVQRFAGDDDGMVDRDQRGVRRGPYTRFDQRLQSAPTRRALDGSYPRQRGRHGSDRHRNAYKVSQSSRTDAAAVGDEMVPDDEITARGDNVVPSRREQRRRYARRRGRGGEGGSPPHLSSNRPQAAIDEGTARFYDDRDDRGGNGGSLSRDGQAEPEQDGMYEEGAEAAADAALSGNGGGGMSGGNVDSGPLSHSETREMVELFRRLFETLSRVLDEPEGGRRSPTVQDTLPDVRMALAEVESLNRMRDVDRQANFMADREGDRAIGFENAAGRGGGGVGEEREAEGGGEGRATTSKMDDASSVSGRGRGEGESGAAEGLNEGAADEDADDDIKHFPLSSPAYGARKKLQNTKSQSVFGGFYDSITSGLSGML